MKKLFLTLITIIAFTRFAAAQVVLSSVTDATVDFANIIMSNPNAANLSSGDIRASIWMDNDGKLKFRNTTAYGYVFRDASNTVDQFTITGSGHVGIGTINPSYLLSVYQSSYPGPQFSLDNGAHNFILTNNPVDNLLSFSYNGNNRLQFNLNDQWFASGKVGIGTTTPNALLNINGPLDGAASLAFGQPGTVGKGDVPVGASTGGYNIDFYTWRDIIPDQIGARIRAERINNWHENSALVQSMDIAFSTSTGSDDLSEKMRIKFNGNVGIGIPNPSEKLTVNGNIRAIIDNVGSPSKNVAGITNLGISGVTGASNWAIRGVYQYGNGVSVNADGGDLDLIKSFNGNTILATKTDGTQLGNVGIGTTSPSSRLHIVKNNGYADPVANATTVDNLITLQVPYQAAPATTIGAGYKWGIQWYGTNELGYGAVKTAAVYAVSEDLETGYNRAVGLAFHTTQMNFPDKEAMRIDNFGNVGIGTITPGSYKLAVNGSIHTKAIVVDLNGFPDYVFKADYKLKSLSEVKVFIDKNHHLPEIPSASEVAKSGLNLGEMNKLLTKKVEELTLYLIEKDQMQKAQEERIKKLEAQMAKLIKE